MKQGPLVLALAGAVAAGAIGWFVVSTGAQPSTTADGAERNAETASIPRGASAELSDVEARARQQRAAAKTADRGTITGPAAAARPDYEAATGPYTGRLLDPLGRPMPGVEVTIQSWEAASRSQLATLQMGVRSQKRLTTTTTADDGTFSLLRKKSLGRSVGISTEVAGYSDDPIKHVLTGESGRDLGDVFLQPAVLVDGWVRDGNQRPVAGARVRRIERNDDATVDVMDRLGFGGLLQITETDEDGRFELPHEDEGPITLMVEHDDILPKRWDGPTKRAGEVLQDVVITVDRAGKIEGHVAGYPAGRRRGMVAAAPLDAELGDSSTTGMAELMAAQLSPAGDHVAEIQPNGSFTIPGLTPGARYRVRAIGKKFFVRTIMLSEPEEARANEGPVTLQFNPGATIRFEAVDRITEAPVESMTISGRYGDRPAFLQLTETAENPPSQFPRGKVTIYELRPRSAPATLTLTIDAPGYFRTRDLEVEVPETGTVNLGKVQLEPAPRVTFRVIDAATKDPVRRARVTLEPANAARAAFGRTRARSDEATEEEKEQQEQAEAMLFGEFPERSRERTDRKGRCTLTMMEGDNVVLEVRARKYAKYVQTHFVAPDGDREVLIELFGGGALEAFVADPNGGPAADVRVECRTDVSGRMTKNGTNTDENGVAEFENLAAGSYEVRAYRVDRSIFARGQADNASHETEWMPIQIARGVKTEIELQVPAVGDLTGIVMLADSPSPDARVSLATPERADRIESMIELQDQFGGMNGDTTTDVTDVDGRFTLTDVVPGKYVLLARHPEVAMVTRKEVTVGEGLNEITVDIPSTSLEGRVVDDQGAPVAGADVSVQKHDREAVVSQRALAREFLQSSSAKATTDINGVYRLIGVRADVPLDVIVHANGYTDAVEGPVNAIEDGTRTVPPIELKRGGVIVVSSTSENLAAAMRFVHAKPIEGKALETDAMEKIALMRGGSARIEGLVAGTWEVRTQTPGETDEDLVTSEPETVVVKPGETIEIEM